MIHDIRPEMPIYALVDLDPDGINILKCYKWGSSTLRHEQNATLPRLRWLGIKSDDIVLSPSHTDALESGGQGGSRLATPSGGSGRAFIEFNMERLEPLTERDGRLATKLLDKLSSNEEHDIDVAEVQRELRTMLMMSYKVEIQAMNEHGDVAGYVERRLALDLGWAVSRTATPQ